MQKNPNKITVDGKVFPMNEFYKQGALACRENVDFFDNPYQEGTQRFFDWEMGFQHEEEGEHSRFGKDLISGVEDTGELFKEDPEMQKNEDRSPSLSL